MKFRFPFILLFSCFVLVAGCQQQEDFSPIYGTWCYQGEGNPKIFTITKDSFQFFNDSPVGITFEKINNQINVLNAAHKNTIISVIEVQKNTLIVYYQGGEKEFTRISEQEAQNLVDTASSSQKATEFPDPF